MKKTFKATDCKRPIELPMENYLAHQEVVEHWCAGGDVEACGVLTGRWYSEPNISHEFDPEIPHRIKQREPKPGEVWVYNDIYAWLRTTTPAPEDDVDMDEYTLLDGWVLLSGDDACDISCLDNIAYSAPSAEAYYARKFLGNKTAPSCMSSSTAVLVNMREAAQLEADNEQ